VELRQYLRVLRAHWVLIVLSVVVCTAAAVGVAATRTPTYQAETQLFVTARPSAEDAGATYQASVFSQERVLSYVQMVSSPAILEPVIDELELQEATGELAGKIHASVPTGTVLLNITVADESPRQAAAIAEAVARQFSAFVSRLETPAGASVSRVTVIPTKLAAVPAGPSSPRRPVYAALGLLFGIVLGVGGAFVREALDRRIRTEDDASSAADAPVLASVAERGGSKVRPLVVSIEPASRRAEAYRRLRANLSALIEARELRAFVVSSVEAGDGAATVAANVATVFAQAGRRVVVVDADLRRQSLAPLFDLAATPGLSNVLTDELSLESVARTGSEDLPVVVVASGSEPSSPSDLLASQRFLAVMAELAERFDVVVVHAPPLLEFTDAAVVARATSGVVVVARFGSTRAHDLRLAVDSLNAVDVGALGVVLNAGRRGRSRGSVPRTDRRAQAPRLSPLDDERVPVR
jgi:polysaccharide biosynthesis transport protein